MEGIPPEHLKSVCYSFVLFIRVYIYTSEYPKDYNVPSVYILKIKIIIIHTYLLQIHTVL